MYAILSVVAGGVGLLSYAILALTASQILGTIMEGITSGKEAAGKKEQADLQATLSKEMSDLSASFEEKKQRRARQTKKKADAQMAALRKEAGKKQNQQEMQQLAMMLAPEMFQPQGIATPLPMSFGGGGVSGMPFAGGVTETSDGNGTEALEAMLAGVSPEFAQETLAAAGGRPPTIAAGVRQRGGDLASMFPTASVGGLA